VAERSAVNEIGTSSDEVGRERMAVLWVCRPGLPLEQLHPAAAACALS
jgi:hypothetical protein